MFFYICQLFLYSSFLFLYTKANNKDVSFTIKIICFAILFIPAALRYEVGTDYNSYHIIFDNINQRNIITVEPGFVLLNKLVYYLTFSCQGVFFLASLFTYFFIFYANDKKTSLYLFSFYIFYYTFSFNIVRNMMAISVVIFGFVQLFHDKKKVGFLFILIALLFHSSAIFYVPVYLLAIFWKNLSKRKILLFAILLIFLSRNIDKILEVITSVNGKYSHYLLYGNFMSESQTNSGLGVILRFTMLFMSYLITDERKMSPIEFRVQSLLFLALLLADLFCLKVNIFGRLVVCFYLYYIFFFRNFSFKSNSSHLVLITKISIFVYYFFFFFVMGLLTNQNDPIPYKIYNIF